MPTAPPQPPEPTYYYSQLDQIGGADGVWDLNHRLPEVQKYAHFKPTDQVIDLGCAEGLITMDIAPKVKHIRGVELRKKRVQAATLIADERGIKNISFEVGSVTTLDLPEKSYDVTLFLGVFHHLPREDRWPSLTRVLHSAKRSVVLRMPLFNRKAPNRVAKLIKLCHESGFALTIYPRHETCGGNFMIANRL